MPHTGSSGSATRMAKAPRLAVERLIFGCANRLLATLSCRSEGRTNHAHQQVSRHNTTTDGGEAPPFEEYGRVLSPLNLVPIGSSQMTLPPATGSSKKTPEWKKFE